MAQWKHSAGMGQSIEITSHAMKRLKERVGTYEPYKSWNQLVKKARYEGSPDFKMTKEEYDYIVNHFDNQKFTNSKKIRVLDGFAYVFAGNNRHGRTLITVIKLELEKN